MYSTKNGMEKRILENHVGTLICLNNDKCPERLLGVLLMAPRPWLDPVTDKSFDA